MERKIKLATAVSLLGLTTVACAPNPYWQAPGSGYNRPVATVRSAPAVGGVTHNHCGKVHTHALPPQGLAHHHGDGCMASAASNTTLPPAQPQGTTYPYSPYTGSTTPPSTSYGYTDYSTPKSSTNTDGTYYYDYTSPSNSSSSTPYTSSTYNSTTYNSNNSNSSNSSNSSTSSASSNYAGGDSYTVQKGDTVFQVMRTTGVYWKDIIRLNNLQAPEYKIQPGQVLRLK